MEFLYPLPLENQNALFPTLVSLPVSIKARSFREETGELVHRLRCLDLKWLCLPLYQLLSGQMSVWSPLHYFFFFLYIVWWRRWRPFIENCLILGHDILVIIDMKVSGTINTSRIKDRVVAKNLDLQNWVYEIGVLERVPENVSGHRSFCHHPSTRRLSACSSVLIKACPSRVSLDWISSSPVPLLPPVPPVWHLPKSALSSKCLCGAFAGDQGLWVMQWCAPHLAVCALRIVVFQKCLWEHLNPGVPLDTNKEQIQIILLVI